MSVSSVNAGSNFQFIQSASNRQRIDEQQRANAQNNPKDEKLASFKAEAKSVNKMASQATYEDVYSEYEEQKSNRTTQSKQVNAYQQVQSQDKMEALQNKVGISVFA